MGVCEMGCIRIQPIVLIYADYDACGLHSGFRLGSCIR